MDYNKIKSKLSIYPESEVGRYINYLKFLETDKDREKKLRNPWFRYFEEDQAIDIYNKVAIDNLSIDGETITLQNKGKVMVSYNYQAYKNRVLNVYPESKFDIQLVCEGDDFSFRKENGSVIYSHKITNPFNTKPNIIGAYCIIKNQRGEFLESLNMTEVNKMKSAAKTKNIWETWESEMILKSVIKRACKRHFRDITTNIDTIDNENYDLERVGFDETIQKDIEDTNTIDELTKLYNKEKNNVTDKVKFITLLGERRKEIMALLPVIKEEDYPKAIKMIKDGTKPDSLLYTWNISKDILEKLILEAAL